MSVPLFVLCFVLLAVSLPPNPALAAVEDGNKTVTIALQNEPLPNVLSMLAPGNAHIYDPEDLKTVTVSAKVENAQLGEALAAALGSAGLTYTISQNTITVRKQQSVSIAAHNQRLDLVLQTMLRGMEYSIRDGADPNTLVSIEALGAPLEASLDRMLSQANLHRRREGNAHVIYRDKEQLFFVHVPTLTQSFSVESSRVGEEDHKGAASGGSSSYTVSAGLSTASSSMKTKGASASVDNLAASVKALLSTTGVITVHKESGAIWVRDRVDIVDRIGRFLGAMNKNLSTPVKINGVITEVTLNDAEEVGIDWDVVVNNITAGTRAAKLVTGGVFTLNLTGQKGNVERVFVKALGKYGDVKVVSRPYITVANNAVGSLTVGDTISYVAQSYTSVATVGYGASAMIVKPLQLGLSFYVVPRVISDDEAVLYISPDMAVLDEMRTIAGRDTVVEAPNFRMRQIQTVIPVKRGEKIVLGGILSDDSKKLSQGLPWLSKIPVLGWVFGQSKSSTQRTELAMMLEVSW